MSHIDDAFAAFGAADALSEDHGEREEAVFFAGVDKSKPGLKLQGVLVNREAYTGTNESPGDGRIIHRAQESSERRSVIVDIPARYDMTDLVQVPNSSKYPDVLQLDDGIYEFKKLMSEDGSFHTYLLAATTAGAIRSPARRA